jgi:hypothetical protein
MSDLSQQIEMSRMQEIALRQKQQSEGSSWRTVLAIAIVALILAVIAYTYYVDLESKVEANQKNVQTLIQNNKVSESPNVVNSQADAIKNGTGNTNVDSVDVEGDPDEGLPANVSAELEVAERARSRYYPELDSVLHGM